MVAVRSIISGIGLSAIGTFVVAYIQNVNYIFIFGVCIDPGVIPGSLPEFSLTVHLLPGLSAILTSVDSPFIFVLNNGPNAVTVCW